MTSICSDNEVRKLDVSGHIKRAGPFLLGPKLGNSPVKSMIHCLARREGTNDYFTVKVLTVKSTAGEESIEDQQGKILLHTEYSLLTLLKGEKGVVQHHGLYKDSAFEEVEVDGEKTVVEVTRLCLVLDCYTPHDFCPTYTQLTNLQYYVLKEKKLVEVEALRIFYSIVQIVERLHEQNIVHRDLKLGNITLNKETKELTLGNFCLGKQLTSENQLLTDQRGSPAYISPDVICGKPYLGKPSDMWALGVLLYTMLYGQFPFFDQTPNELFRKIKAAEFVIPMDPYVSVQTIELIKSLLVLNPKERLTTSQVLRVLRDSISTRSNLTCDTELPQVVPNSRPLKRSHSESVGASEGKTIWSKASVSDIENLLASATSREEEKANEPQEEDESVSVHEPPKKVSKASRFGLGTMSVKLMRVKEDARVLTVGDLQKLYAVYVANKAKQAAAAAAAASASPAYPSNNNVAAPHEPTLFGSAAGSAISATNGAGNAPTSQPPMRTLQNNAERVPVSRAALYKPLIPIFTTSAKSVL